MKRSIFLLVVANLTLAFVIYLSFRNRTPKFENFENLIVETISNLEEISIDQPERKLSVIIKDSAIPLGSFCIKYDKLIPNLEPSPNSLLTLYK